MATSPALVQRPAPVSRLADWLVLAVVVGALLAGWLLRQQTLFATQTVDVGPVQMAVPADSIPLTDGDQFATVTPEGLTVRFNTLPAPSIGLTDTVALLANRALLQGQSRDMYQTIASDATTVGERPAGILEFAYVDADDSFFSSSLQVVRGYDLLVGEGDQLYVLTLEGPDSRWADVQALWPRLRNSLRFVGGDR